MTLRAGWSYHVPCDIMAGIEPENQITQAHPLFT
jgi:hypothetical protein